MNQAEYDAERTANGDKRLINLLYQKIELQQIEIESLKKELALQRLSDIGQAIERELTNEEIGEFTHQMVLCCQVHPNSADINVLGLAQIVKDILKKESEREMKQMKHKHAELIKAWADGAKIDFWSRSLEKWVADLNPDWLTNCEYRVKPEPKPDVVLYSIVGELINGIGADGIGAVVSSARSYMVTGYKGSNVKYIFDGETGELKSVEIMK
jgi:hypothetical protein